MVQTKRVLVVDAARKYQGQEALQEIRVHENMGDAAGAWLERNAESLK